MKLNKFYDVNSELAFLGSILFEPKIIYKALVELESEKYFYTTNHQVIYSTMQKMVKENIGIDAISIIAKLTEQNKKISWSVVIAEAVEKTISPSSWKTYAKIIKEKYNLRELWKLGKKIVSQCETNELDTKEILEKAQTDILKINKEKNIIETQLISQIIPGYLKKLENATKTKDKINSIKTGIKYLDKLTYGFQPSDLIYLAGRPSMGKTAVALKIINTALQNKKNTLLFSLEMSKEQILNRFISMQSKINGNEFLSCEFSENSWQGIISACEFYNETTLFINDNSGLSPQDVFSISKAINFEKKLDFIVVDYLQFLKLNLQNRNSNKTEATGEASKILKTLAKDLNVPVLVLSQLSRSLESRTDKHPQLSDLRDSGNLEQDADLVIFAYRDEYYRQEQIIEYLGDAFENISNKDVLELIIAKHRNGRLGTAVTRFIKEFQHIEDYYN